MLLSCAITFAGTAGTLGKAGTALTTTGANLMNIKIILSEMDITRLVMAEIQNKLGDIQLGNGDVKIMVKTKHNFKAEWETGEFQAVYQNYTDLPKVDNTPQRKG